MELFSFLCANFDTNCSFGHLCVSTHIPFHIVITQWTVYVGVTLLLPCMTAKQRSRVLQLVVSVPEVVFVCVCLCVSACAQNNHKAADQKLMLLGRNMCCGDHFDNV